LDTASFYDFHSIEALRNTRAPSKQHRGSSLLILISFSLGSSKLPGEIGKKRKSKSTEKFAV